MDVSLLLFTVVVLIQVYNTALCDNWCCSYIDLILIAFEHALL